MRLHVISQPEYSLNTRRLLLFIVRETLCFIQLRFFFKLFVLGTLLFKVNYVTSQFIKKCSCFVSSNYHISVVY